MTGKNVLVIGGTSGYGAGIAEVFKSSGANVISVGRTSKNPLDIKDFAGVEKWFKENIKEIDVVVYSAGIALGKSKIADKDISQMNSVFQVNTIGLLNVLKNSFPYLNKSKGHFFHVGSIANNLSYVGGADYCASKSASSTIMQTVRKEWLGTGIHTCSLEVGLGDTSFQKNRYNGDLEKAGKHTKGIRQIKPIDLGLIVLELTGLPEYLNIDEITIKPIDQASHGITVNNIKKQF